jgi:hypothetical protein
VLRGIFKRERRKLEEAETNDKMNSLIICVIHETLISSVVLYECTTWSLILLGIQTGDNLEQGGENIWSEEE